MCYYIRAKRGSNDIVIPIIFIAIILVASVLTWNGWYSVFIMAGLVVNTISLSLSDPQQTRATMLIKSPLCLVYNVFVFSLGGMLYESAVLISSVIGLWNNRSSKVTIENKDK